MNHDRSVGQGIPLVAARREHRFSRSFGLLVVTQRQMRVTASVRMLEEHLFDLARVDVVATRHGYIFATHLTKGQHYYRKLEEASGSRASATAIAPRADAARGLW